MAIRFDAAADRILATANLLSNEGPYTHGADFYWESATGSDEVLITLNDDDPDAIGNDSRDHCYIKGSDSTLRLFTANGSGGYGFGTGSTLSTGTWYNIMVVRESATSIKVYLNGVLDITVTADVSGRESFTRQEYCGFTSTDIQRFNGRLQNLISIDGVALTAAEVASQAKRFTPIRLGSTNRWTPGVMTGADRAADWIGKYSWTVNGTLTDAEGQGKAWGSRVGPRITLPAAGVTLAGTMTATSSGTCVLNEQLGGTMTATSTGTLPLVKSIGGTGQATAGGTLAVARTLGATMTATSNGDVAFAKLIGGTMQATAGGALALVLVLGGTMQATSYGLMVAGGAASLSGTMQATSSGVLLVNTAELVPSANLAAEYRTNTLQAVYGLPALGATYRSTKSLESIF